MTLVPPPALWPRGYVDYSFYNSSKSDHLMRHVTLQVVLQIVPKGASCLLIPIHVLLVSDPLCIMLRSSYSLSLAVSSHCFRARAQNAFQVFLVSNCSCACITLNHLMLMNFSSMLNIAVVPFSMRPSSVVHPRRMAWSRLLMRLPRRWLTILSSLL